MPDFSHEINFGRHQGKVICGVDEVGRGPLAGPVVAAAVILPLEFPHAIRRQIRDSKKMSASAREDIYEPLRANCLSAVDEASVSEIDQLNILWASMLAMHRAIVKLNILIDIALIDGNRVPKMDCASFPIVKGDDKSYSIAAASIIAKVHRDRLMKKLAEEFPFYGWERNAGYGTSEHRAALTQYGMTIWHRMTFAPCRDAIKY